MSVASFGERVYHLDHEAVHVCKRKHAHHSVTRLKEGQTVDTELQVGPQVAIGEHHSFGKTRRTGCIVYHSHSIGILVGITYIGGQKTFRIFFTEKTVQVVACRSEFFIPREQQRIIVYKDSPFKKTHRLLIKVFPCGIVYKKQTCFAMVDQMVYRISLEIVKNRNRHRTVSQRRQSGNCPLCGIASANSDFVATPQAAVLEKQMKLRYLAGHVAELE